MKQAAIFIAAVLLCAHVATVAGLSCERPFGKKCADPGPCAYGTVGDICNHCQICAKGPGEKCGGIWNHGGTCASNLRCTNPPGNKRRDQRPGKCVADY